MIKYIIILAICIGGCGAGNHQPCDYNTKHGICVYVSDNNHPSVEEIETVTERVIDWFIPYCSETKSLWVMSWLTVRYFDGFSVECHGYPGRACSNSSGYVSISESNAVSNTVGLLWHELGHSIMWNIEELALINHHTWMCETEFDLAACRWK